MLKEDTVNPAESASSGCMAGFVFAVVVFAIVFLGVMAGAGGGM